jgi:tRNA pseudouridine38-40 synthase
MARYQIIVAYDGTDFFGFQRQAKPEKSRTVQAELERALRSAGWQGRAILAAGRTDAGVHAVGQVVAFDLDWRHAADALRAALNANLPADVAVQAVCETRADFHPRYDATARRYRYQIIRAPVRSPLRERYAWRISPAPDVQRMQAVAAELLGEHDFAAFGAPPHPEGMTIRKVIQAEWWAQDDLLTFEITANAFLFHMVRRLVGFQVSVGQGKVEFHGLEEHLHKGAARRLRRLAPAHGLTLMEVYYPPALTE